MKNNNIINEKELDMFMEGFIKEDILIPEELDIRIEEKIDSLKPVTHRNQGKTLIVSGLCFIILFLGAIRVSPTMATYASSFKVLKPIVKWIRGIDRGIENARESGYPSLEPIFYSEDGYNIKLDNMFIDEERFFITVEISGSKIERLAEEYSDLDIKAYLKTDNLSNNQYMTPRYIDGTKDDRILGSFEIDLSHGLYKILEEYSNSLRVEFSLNHFNYSDKVYNSLHKFKPIELSMDKSNIFRSRVYPVEGKFKYRAGEFDLKSLRVSPTQMRLSIDMLENDNYHFRSFENFYLKDDKGNIYKPEGKVSSISGGAPVTNKNRYIELYFVPSIYFKEDIKEFSFHMDGLRYDLINERTVNLSLEDSYPKKKIYMGEEFVFSKPYRNSDENLVVEFEVRFSEKFKYINLQLSTKYGIVKTVSYERNKITNAGKEILKCKFVYDVLEDNQYEFNINGLGYYEKREIDIPIKSNN